MDSGRSDPDPDAAADKPPPTSSSLPPRLSLSESSICARPPAGDSSESWNDWRWQMRHRLRTVEELVARFPQLRVTSGMVQAARIFPMALTPYYASLIRRLDESDPIFRMAVPQGDELVNPPSLSDDPLAEEADMPVPGLVHRYRDRALLIATTTCASYCRHCTRKRVAGQRELTVSRSRLAMMVDYLSMHPEIRDVVISGGDPFTLATDVLERVLQAVRSVPSVEIVRVGTRTPVVLPMRITDDLLAMLRRYAPIYVNTHFNHPAELTPDAQHACARLADAGVPVGNQTVLLRGVNDDARLLEELFRGLLRVRVRPYYLFQCDLVRGVEHFRTPLSRGIEIMEYLRGRMSGLGIPTFVVDAPQGGGKIPLLPNYVVSVSPTHTVLRNYEGRLVVYPEPADTNPLRGVAPPPSAETAAGVWELMSGQPAPAAVPRARRADRPAARRPLAGRPSVEQMELQFSHN